MNQKSLEDRIENLERRVAELEAERPVATVVPWWEKIVGTFANDSVYEEISRLGQEFRQSARPKLEKRKTKRQS